MSVAPVTITLNERMVYDVDWLEDCYKQVRWPNPKCEDFLVEVNKVLSHKIRGELDNPIKQQALFKLLGEDYVKIHFPHHKYQPKLLEPPKTKPDVKEACMKEMKQLLEEQLGVAMKDMGYPGDVSCYDGKDELGGFIVEVNKVFKEELDIQMQQARHEDKRNEVEADAISAAGDDKALEQTISTFKDSDVPGEAFVSAARNNVQVAKTALKQFKEKYMIFPKPVRQFLWEEFVVMRHAESNPGSFKGLNLGQIIAAQRKDFRKGVQKKIKPGTMARAVQSNDAKSIYSVIIDSYHTTKVMKPFYNDEDHMLNGCHCINVINVMDKYYSNAQIFWLLPWQMVYPQCKDENLEDYILKLTNFLFLFSRHCALPWKDVFTIADDVLKTLEKKDPDYYEHLKKSMAEKVSPVDVYDFAYEIVHKDTKKSNKIWHDLYKRRKKDWKDKDLEHFGNPAIFLRKWISEAFAGIFCGTTLLYVWDYLFMNQWSKKAFMSVAMVTLMMIKPMIVQNDNHRKVSKVILEECSNIYIGDLRRGLMAFKENKDDLEAICKLNTYIDVTEEPKPEAAPAEEEPEVAGTEDAAEDPPKEDAGSDETKPDEEKQEAEGEGEAKPEEAQEQNGDAESSKEGEGEAPPEGESKPPEENTEPPAEEKKD